MLRTALLSVSRRARQVRAWPLPRAVLSSYPRLITRLKNPTVQGLQEALGGGPCTAATARLERVGEAPGATSATLT